VQVSTAITDDSATETASGEHGSSATEKTEAEASTHH
jgi:hypothetical protein